MDPVLALKRLRALVALSLTVGVLSQTSPPFTAGEPLRVEFDHTVRFYQAGATPTDPAVLCQTSPPGPDCFTDTTSYELRVDGTVVQTIPATAPARVFALPTGFTAGSHTVVVSAVGPGGTTPAAGVGVSINPFVPNAPAGQGAPSLERIAQPVVPLSVAVRAPWVSSTAGTSVTSAAFSATAQELLIVLAAGDGCSSAPATFSVGNAPNALSWAPIAASSATNDGSVRAWAARPTATIASTSVTVTISCQTARAVQVLAVSGTHLTQPIGATWSGPSNTSTTNNWTPTTYASTTPGSMGIGVAVDYRALGSPTTSETSLGGGHLTGLYSWLSVRKTDATPGGGVPVSVNFNAAGTGTPQWRAIAFEVRPR